MKDKPKVRAGDRRIPLKAVMRSDAYPDRIHILMNVSADKVFVIEGNVLAFTSQSGAEGFINDHDFGVRLRSLKVSWQNLMEGDISAQYVILEPQFH